MARFVQFSTDKLPGGSTTLDRVVASVAAAFAELRNALTFDALRTYVITPSGTKVYHGLGRKPRGYILCGLSADARVWTGASDGNEARYLPLVSSSSVTATLLFF